MNLEQLVAAGEGRKRERARLGTKVGEEIPVATKASCLMHPSNKFACIKLSATFYCVCPFFAILFSLLSYTQLLVGFFQALSLALFLAFSRSFLPPFPASQCR